MNKIKPFENYSNTVFDRFPEDRNQISIFVSIPSYRDSNVVDTVRSLFQNAKYPQNIYVSVAIASIHNHEAYWSDEQDFKRLIGFDGHVQVKRVDVDDDNVSIGYLRSIADSAYNKEMFYLSVASSSEFDPYWDDILIKSYDCVQKISKNNNFIFTCIPRFFLRHDDVVDGYVFYTNHKTKISMQREESDCSKIPTIGYSDFINFDDIDSPFLFRKDKETALNIDKLIQEQGTHAEFLSENGYPSVSYRKFFDNEVISLAYGFSSRFVFGEAKTVMKSNPSDVKMVTENQNDFNSMINFINSDITMYSLRWTPVYYLPDHLPNLSPKRHDPLELEKNVLMEKEATDLIKNKVDKLMESGDLEKISTFNCLCGIDWDNKTFKVSRNLINSHICDSINTFVSLYNFSMYENSLHWNKRG